MNLTKRPRFDAGVRAAGGSPGALRMPAYVGADAQGPGSRLTRQGALFLSRLLRWGAAMLAMLCAAPAVAEPSEAAVKAAYLTKFPAYVDWPASLRLAPNAPITLCIVGGDPFGRMIDERARGRRIDRHPLVLRRMASAAGADACQVAFVDGNAAYSTVDLLHALEGKPVLTVTDGRGGPERGMIHFVVDGGRVRFHIDQAAAESRGLGLSARLLAIALSVRTNR